MSEQAKATHGNKRAAEIIGSVGGTVELLQHTFAMDHGGPRDSHLRETILIQVILVGMAGIKSECLPKVKLYQLQDRIAKFNAEVRELLKSEGVEFPECAE